MANSTFLFFRQGIYSPSQIWTRFLFFKQGIYSPIGFSITTYLFVIWKWLSQIWPLFLFFMHGIYSPSQIWPLFLFFRQGIYSADRICYNDISTRDMEMTQSQIWPLFYFSGRESIVQSDLQWRNLTTFLFFRQGIYSPIGFANDEIATRDMEMTLSQIWPLFLFFRQGIYSPSQIFDHFFIFQAGNL